MDRDEETDSVETVTDATKSEASLDAKLVDKSAAKDTDHSKGAVERSVLSRSVF